jgi:ABC-type nickel/cobalt efflux system permease component RcnA
MMILVTAIFLHVLVSLAVYLYIFGIFNRPYLRVFQVAFYLLLICYALTIGIGIEYVLRYLRPTGNTLAALE